MAVMLKQVDEMKVYTEEEAKNLIEKYKEKAREEGYEVVKSSSTLKEKKARGEIVDAWYVVSITKRWNE